jgi:hypothetical protein
MVVRILKIFLPLLLAFFAAASVAVEKQVQNTSRPTAVQLGNQSAPGGSPVPTASYTESCSGGLKLTLSTGSQPGTCGTSIGSGVVTCYVDGKLVARGTCSGCTQVNSGASCSLSAQ